MKWMRYTAFATGMIFGGVFLVFDMGARLHRPGVWETLPLLTGPVTLFAASAIGLRFEKTAGWWLILGGAATAFLFTAQAHALQNASRLAVVIAVLCLPMVCSGVLWLAHADYKAPDGEHLPFMS